MLICLIYLRLERFLSIARTLANQKIPAYLEGSLTENTYLLEYKAGIALQFETNSAIEMRGFNISVMSANSRPTIGE